MADERTTLSPEGLRKLDKDSADGHDELVEKAIADAGKDVYEYEGKKYTAHPAASLFPLIEGDDFDALVVSIKHHGMRHPIVLLGDQIVDGRNRFRAAKKCGAKIRFVQMDPREDPCAVVMDMNINRRDLDHNQRVALASTLRRLALRLAALRREANDRAAREKRERERAAAQAEGAGQDGSGRGDSAPKPDVSAAGDAAAPAAGVDAEAEAGTAGESVSALDEESDVVSREKAAKAAGVSRASLERFDKVVEKAPELQQPIAEGEISVSDAAAISEEAPEVRRQAVEDVRKGRARTGAQAVEKRTGRAPKARARQKKPSVAGAQGDEGGSGLPALPSVGGAADGKDAAGTGVAPAVVQAGAAGDAVAPQPSRPALSDVAMSPMLLLAGVRKVMSVIHLDPCSSEIANGKVRALRYFSRDDDGPQQAWNADDVYVFPPPKFAGRFASKLTGEMFAGRVRRALFLAPSDLSDQDQAVLLRNTQLTGIVYETERTSYDVEGGGKVKAPTRMVLYVFGIEKKELYSAFESWGKVFVTAGRQ